MQHLLHISACQVCAMVVNYCIGLAQIAADWSTKVSLFYSLLY